MPVEAGAGLTSRPPWAAAARALAGRAARRSWTVARRRYLRRLRRDDPTRRPAPQVLVWQMGSVGSSTVRRSLEAHAPKLPVYHVHALSKKGIRFLRKINRANWPAMPEHARHLWRSEHLRRRLREGPGDGRWKVVSLVRDPIARSISGFFHVLEFRYGFGFAERAAGLSPEALQHTLEELFWRHATQDDRPLEFFDREFKPLLGLDVYAEPFPCERGYQIYEAPEADVLVLKLERLHEVAREAFDRFLGLEHFSLVSANVAEEKEYAEAYRRFRRVTPMEEWFVEQMLGSRLVRHFYSEAEVEALRTHWTCCPRP